MLCLRCSEKHHASDEDLGCVSYTQHWEILYDVMCVLQTMQPPICIPFAPFSSTWRRPNPKASHIRSNLLLRPGGTDRNVNIETIISASGAVNLGPEDRIKKDHSRFPGSLVLPIGELYWGEQAARSHPGPRCHWVAGIQRRPGPTASHIISKPPPRPGGRVDELRSKR